MTHTTDSGPSPSSLFSQRFRDLGSLRRASDHRAVAGVAEGLSRHFDVDPVIVRVAFAALTLFGGAGVLLYLALWLTVPVDNTEHSVISGRLNRDPNAWVTAGLGIGGIIAAAALLGSISWAVPHPFPVLLVVLLAALGIFALARRRDGGWTSPAARDRQTQPPAPPGGPEAPGDQTRHDAPTSGDSAATTTSTPGAALAPTSPGNALAPTAPPGALPAATAPDATTIAAGTAFTAGTPGSTTATTVIPVDPAAPDAERDPAGARAWWQRDDVPPSGTPAPPFPGLTPPPKRPRSHLFGLTMAVVAFTMAGLWIFDETTSSSVDPSVYPGTALGIIAAGLIVGAWWGRSRGLIAMGVIATVVTSLAAFAGPGPYGQKVVIPVQASQLQSHYSWGVGALDLHLEQVSDIGNLDGRTVSLDARIGQIRVIIPSTVAATVDATVDHGRIDGPMGVQDRDNGGQHVLMTPGTTGKPAMRIHVHLRYGEIEIDRAACPGTGALPAVGESTWNWNGDSNVAAACN